MHQLGIDGKYIFENMREYVTIDGLLTPNLDEHGWMLRFYVNFNHDSEMTRQGISYWLRNWKEFAKNRIIGIEEVAAGLSALFEYDYDILNKQIDDHKNFLLSQQQADGSFTDKSNDYYSKIYDTSRALSSLSLVLDINDPVLKRGKDFIINILKSHKIYKEYSHLLPVPVLALISMADGPKVSQELYERELKKMKQHVMKVKPIFTETSPNISKRSLRVTIEKMLRDAQNEILITSPYLDMFYEEIEKKILDNSSIKVRIVTRPKSDINQGKSRIASAALDILKIATKGAVRVSELVHSRVMIVDSNKMIISSADLTRDQLIAEYNTGLYTEDKEVIKQGIEYFDNLYNASKALV